MKVTIVRKVVEEIEVSEEVVNNLICQDNMTEEEHLEWLEFGKKFAEPYGGWTYGSSAENGLMAVYNTDGEIITEA